jgi:hypothetical protein
MKFCTAFAAPIWNFSIVFGDDKLDDDKLYLTTLTLSAKAGFHNGRVNKSKFTKKDKGSKNLHAYMWKRKYTIIYVNLLFTIVL